ncbi:hypothetical protein [Streptosporangium sp. NPDC048865]
MSTSVRTCRVIYPHVTAVPHGHQRAAGEVEDGDVVAEVGAERQLRPP